METNLTPIDPRKAFTWRYALYERLRARTAHLSYRPDIPVELLHVNQLNRPEPPLGDPLLIKAFSPFNEDCSPKEIASYMDMATQALVRTQFLYLGQPPVVTRSPDSRDNNAWFAEYDAEVPLSLGELRPYRDIVATARIITQEKETRSGRSTKRFIAIAGLMMEITGLHIRHKGKPIPFSTHAEIIDDWAWANDAAVGAKDMLRFPAERIASVLQYTDALRFVENHRAKP